MNNNNFTENDKEQFIAFLNFMAERAKFDNWSTQDSITHFKLLAHMQQTILPKIENHIFEIKEVIESTKEGENDTTS